MKVVITDIKDDQLKVAEAELKVITENILALPVDSTDEASLEKAADVVEKHFGNLHVLLNNAGIGGGDKILNTPDEKWRNVYEVNVYGPLNGIKQFLPRMLAHGEVAHTSTCFVQRHRGHGHQSAYGTSKFALVGMSEYLRNDLADSNVGVSVLCPNVVDTQLSTRSRRA